MVSCRNDEPIYQFLDQNILDQSMVLVLKIKENFSTIYFHRMRQLFTCNDTSESGEVCEVSNDAVTVVFSIPKEVGLYELFLILSLSAAGQ